MLAVPTVRRNELLFNQLCAPPRVIGLMMVTGPALAFTVMPLLSVIVLPAVPNV